ncbi:hypothetical protein AUJ14_04375 [Candidatus Micrarchaeota archaeon CG1_02_55_22]|nr:MAG: hypothetical protein AUJ14_04375 [Candidatus Micrarchaeota archaeon CG1_02_55_22]
MPGRTSRTERTFPLIPGTPRELAVLERNLASQNYVPRNNAALALGTHEHPFATDILIHAARTSTVESTRFMAASKLINRLDESAIPFWITRLQAPDFLVRECAEAALTAYPHEAVATPLIEKLGTVINPQNPKQRELRTKLQALLHVLRQEILFNKTPVPAPSDRGAYAILQQEPLTHPQALVTFHAELANHARRTRVDWMMRAREVRDEHARRFPPDEQFPPTTPEQLRIRHAWSHYFNQEMVRQIEESAETFQGPRPGPARFKHYPKRR